MRPAPRSSIDRLVAMAVAACTALFAFRCTVIALSPYGYAAIIFGDKWAVKQSFCNFLSNHFHSKHYQQNIVISYLINFHLGTYTIDFHLILIHNIAISHITIYTL